MREEITYTRVKVGSGGRGRGTRGEEEVCFLRTLEREEDASSLTRIAIVVHCRVVETIKNGFCAGFATTFFAVKQLLLLLLLCMYSKNPAYDGGGQQQQQ